MTEWDIKLDEIKQAVQWTVPIFVPTLNQTIPIVTAEEAAGNRYRIDCCVLHGRINASLATREMRLLIGGEPVMIATWKYSGGEEPTIAHGLMVRGESIEVQNIDTGTATNGFGLITLTQL